jgi:glycerol uptake facilitator-like aquaporin
MPPIQLWTPKLTPFQCKWLAEGCGTFVFVLTIFLAEMNTGQGAVNGKDHWRNLAPIAIGFILSVLVFTFGYISGGHFNPAITLGVMLVNQIRIELAVAYVIAQCSGGALGALMGVIMLGRDSSQPAPTVSIGDDPTYLFRGLLAEGIFTFALVTVVLHVACSTQKNNHYYGFAIGMCVLCAAYAVGGVTGGAFNPAVATGLVAVKCLMGWCTPVITLWLYWAGPAAGAAGAAVVFKMVAPKIQKVQKPVAAPPAEPQQQLY